MIRLTSKFGRVIPYQSHPLQIFSPNLWVVFLFIFFAMQKLLSLSRSHLFIFAFISIILGDGSKKMLLWFMSEGVLPMCSSRYFILSGRTFRSLIHFELIFVYGVRECSSFILSHVALLFSQRQARVLMLPLPSEMDKSWGKQQITKSLKRKARGRDVHKSWEKKSRMPHTHTNLCAFLYKT